MNGIKSGILDVIIIGGSYAGLSAAMALGRSIRNVVVIDSSNPCNKQTPHSHNLITHDGDTPGQIAQLAKEQVLRYETVKFVTGLAKTARKTQRGFEVETQAGEIFESSKLLFATGIFDIMPEINGFAECWGISVLHCPYCHGYEVKQKNIGIIGNGATGFELCRLISNWTNKLTLFTNGQSTLTDEQTAKIKSHQIDIIEKEISGFDHESGQIKHIAFIDQTAQSVDAVFARVGFRQHCAIPEQLGCELTEQGYIKVDELLHTTVNGVFAAGDNITPFRSVAQAIAAGTKAGASINRDMIEENF